MSGLASVINARLQQQQQAEELEAQRRANERSGRNQMIGSGLGVAGALGGAYLGSEAGSAALTSALGLGGGSTAAGSGASLMAASTPLSVTGGTTGAGGALGAGAMGAIAPIAGAALAVPTAIESIRGIGNVIEGDDMSLTQQAALALPTFGTSFLYNPIKDMLGSGKDKDQLQRDDWRANEQEQGYIDENYQLGGYDVGLDGGEPNYNVNFEQEGAGEAVGYMNPLLNLDEMIMGSDNPEKLHSDATGYYSNAAMAQDDPKAFAKEQYEKRGYDRDGAYTAVLNMEGLDPKTRNAYLAAIDDVFGVENPNQGKGGREEFGDAYIE